MTSLRDQFSAVRKAQFDAQFDFFNSMTSQAIESASRMAALNLAVSRDAVQRSLGTGFALMNSRDPRDVLSLGGQAEEQMRSLFAYGRELLGIAGGGRPYALRPQALALAPQAAAETVEVVEQALADTAPAIEAAAEAVTENLAAVVPAEAQLAEPVVVAESPATLDALVAEPAPVAEPKPIAKAAGKGSPRAAAAAHPAAAPVAELDAGEAPKVELPPASPKRKK